MIGKFKAIGMAVAVGAIASGCTGYGTITRNLSKDGAIVQIELSSPWGPQKFTRIGVSSNTVGNTILAEGGRVIINPQITQSPQRTQSVPLSVIQEALARKKLEEQQKILTEGSKGSEVEKPKEETK